MHVVSLFDKTGIMVEPWLELGYDCWVVDIAHPAGHHTDGKLHRIGADLMHGVPEALPTANVAFACAFPPCDHLAVSGARWFKGKGLRALADSIHLFATATEYLSDLHGPWMIENPVSTISTYWRKPDHIFHPWQYAGLEPADNYTKKTCLWVNDQFVMPSPNPLPDGPEPDSRIHRAPPGPGHSDFRSATPKGFAKAVYLANKGICR